MRFDSGLVATMDVDLLWDVRRNLMLAIDENGDPEDFIDVLRKVDKTFQIRRHQRFRVTNKDGYMVVPDPRAFALHKFWVSQRDDREPVKKNRDGLQAMAVAELVMDRLPQLKFNEEQLRMFPPSLVTRFTESLEGDIDISMRF